MQNNDNERTVLSLILMKEALLDSVFLDTEPEYFSHPHYKEVFKTIRMLQKQSIPIDIVSVSTSLIDQKKLDNMGGRAFINDILMEQPSLVTAPYMANILEKNYNLRQLYGISEQVKEAVNKGANPDDIIAGCMDDLHKLCLKDKNNNKVSLLDEPDYYLRLLDKEEEEPTELFYFLFPSLDEKVFMCRGDVLAVGADTSMGKSVLCGCAAISSHHQDYPCTVFSLEMKKEEYINRLYANKCEIDINKFKKKEFTDKEVETIQKATTSFFNYFDLTIFDKPGVDTDYIYQKLLIEKKRKGKLGLVIVDHIHLMKGKGRSEKEQLTQIAESLKWIAMELDCFMIMVCQFKRREQKNQRGETFTPKPSLHDFKESGDIENVANIALLLHRQSRDAVLAEVNVAKNRDGKIGEVFLNFYGQYSKFTSTKKQNF